MDAAILFQKSFVVSNGKPTLPRQSDVNIDQCSFLKIAVTMAHFHASGSLHLSQDVLNILVNGFFMITFVCCKKKRGELYPALVT